MYTVGSLLANRYRLEQVRGAGGMGRVWEATDTLLDRVVAIKEVVLHNVADEAAASFYGRATREARNAARVSHLHDVVTIFDVIVEENGRPWIIMEFVDCPTLQQHVKQHGPMTPEVLAPAATRLLRVLAEVHSAGIMHRDIKPANLMVRPDGTFILLDFGIARFGDDTLTAKGSMIGTAAYMAPEYIKHPRPTSASDAWSLGVTLRYALTGESPFQRDTTPSTISAVMHDVLPPLPGDKPIHAMIEGLLERDTAQRLSIDKAVQMLGSQPADIAPAVATTGNRRKRRWLYAGASAAATVVLMTAYVQAGSPYAPWEASGAEPSPSPSPSASVSASASPASSTAPADEYDPRNVADVGDMRVTAVGTWFIGKTDGGVVYMEQMMSSDDLDVSALKGDTLRDAVDKDRRKQKYEEQSSVSYTGGNTAVWYYGRMQCFGSFVNCTTYRGWVIVRKMGDRYVKAIYGRYDKKETATREAALQAANPVIDAVTFP
jgi:serine/threonine protein kinase